MKTAENVNSECAACGALVFSLKPYPKTKVYSPALDFREIRECQICHFGQALPTPTREALDAYYEDGQYWHATSANKSLLAHNKVQSKYRVLQCLEYLRERPSICALDVGAGGGFIADWLAHYSDGKSVVYDFMESDPIMSEKIQAKELGVPISRVVWNELKENSYDIIFLNHVLEHVDEPVGFLQKMITLLKPGGYCYVETPYRDDEFKEDVFPHTLFFTLESFEGLARRLKVKTCVIKTFGDRAAADKVRSRQFMTKLKMKLFTMSVEKTDLWPLQEFLDNLLFKYKKTTDRLWISWLLQKS